MDRDIFYWKVTDLWKRFCEKHADLLDKTYEEYSCLISREIEKLEECIKEKNRNYQGSQSIRKSSSTID